MLFTGGCLGSTKTACEAPLFQKVGLTPTSFFFNTATSWSYFILLFIFIFSCIHIWCSVMFWFIILRRIKGAVYKIISQLDVAVVHCTYAKTNQCRHVYSGLQRLNEVNGTVAVLWTTSSDGVRIEFAFNSEDLPHGISSVLFSFPVNYNLGSHFSRQCYR